MLVRLSDNSVRLCGKGPGRCCPVVTKIDEDTYEVEDDYGNKIRVKKAELELMTDAMTSLDSKTNEQLLCE